MEELNILEEEAQKVIAGKNSDLLDKFPDLKDNWHFFENFSKSVQVYGKDKTMLLIEEIEKEYQLAQAPEKVTGWQAMLDKVKQKIDLSIDELANLFLPVPAYQLSLQNVSRSSEVQIVSPQNGYEVNEQHLLFELKEPCKETISLSIENNEQICLEELDIQGGQKEFSISLKSLQQVPGRYYWKIKADKYVVLGEFFIDKNLMSKN